MISRHAGKCVPVSLSPSTPGRLAKIVLAEGILSEKDFAAFLHSHIQMRAKTKLHEKKGAYKTQTRASKAATGHKHAGR